MPQAAMDAGAFAEMKELMGDTFKDIIKMCLQRLPQQLDDIRTAIEDRDVDNLFNISHKMKSSCGSIGAFGLAEKVETIEIIGRKGSTEVSDQIFNELRDATNQVISILNAELDD